MRLKRTKELVGWLDTFIRDVWMDLEDDGIEPFVGDNFSFEITAKIIESTIDELLEGWEFEDAIYDLTKEYLEKNILAQS